MPEPVVKDFDLTREFWLESCFIQPQLNRITRAGETIQMEPKIMRVLVCLAEHHTQVVTRDQLLAAVWGEVFVSEQVLSRSISELRKVLADDPKAQSMIETIPKTGYRLIAPLRYELTMSQPTVTTNVEAPQTLPELSSTLATALIPKPVSPLVGRGIVALSLMLCAAAILLAVWGWTRNQTGTDRVLRLSLDLSEPIPPELDPFQTFALAPDGKHFVHVGRRDGKNLLFVRALDQHKSTLLAGTEGALCPFFSPDSQWVGFCANGQLKKVPLSGGTPQALGASASDGVGASWSEAGPIVYAPRFFDGLWQVPASGGKAEPLTKLDWQRGERAHFWPEVLPGGKAVLFTIWHGGGVNSSEIAVYSLASGEKKILLKNVTRARYVTTGHLLVTQHGALQLVPFDLRRLEVTGAATTLPEKVVVSPISSLAHYDCTPDGMLVYLPESAQRSDCRLWWLDRQGRSTPLSDKVQSYGTPRLSQNGQHLAVAVPGHTTDLWNLQLSNGHFKRLTFEQTNTVPLWTPDNRRLVFSSDLASAPLNLYWKAADGSDNAERLTTSSNLQLPGTFTPDGKTLLFTEIDPNTRNDIWALEVNEPTATRRPRPLLQTEADEAQPALSPDGRWLAYTTKDSGQWQIYVQSFPDLQGKWQISTEGGMEPVWSKSGKELFYRAGDKVMAVTISTASGFQASAPQPAFTGLSGFNAGTLLPTYDVTPDGQRIVILKGEHDTAPTQLHAIVNWFSDLQKK
ncbi:MAG: PD40 domain-containing protein [Blastocatellia bacterium]|nr:PD40 domain-containing protein [Blastocatellia bacterium]